MGLFMVVVSTVMLTTVMCALTEYTNTMFCT